MKLIILTLSLIGSSLFVSAQLSVPQEGLIAFYELDGNAEDSWSNELHGYMEYTEPTMDRFGQDGYALYFNGESSYVNTNHSFDFNTMSVSAWFKSEDSSGTGEEAKVVLTQDSVELTEGLYRIDFTDGDLQLWAGGNAYVYSEDATLNEWIHVVLVRSGPQVFYYINGEPVGTGMSNDYASGIHPNTDLVIGIGRSLFYQYYRGAIDDVAIYNRKLTNSEILAMYEYQPTFIAENSGQPHGLRVQWKNDGIDLWHSGKLEGYGVEILSLDGKKVSASVISNDEYLRLNMEDPREGIYILAIRDEKKKLWYSEKAYVSR
jgi:hypothetical protein